MPKYPNIIDLDTIKFGQVHWNDRFGIGKIMVKTTWGTSGICLATKEALITKAGLVSKSHESKVVKDCKSYHCLFTFNGASDYQQKLLDNFTKLDDLIIELAYQNQIAWKLSNTHLSLDDIRRHYCPYLYKNDYGDYAIQVNLQTIVRNGFQTELMPISIDDVSIEQSNLVSQKILPNSAFNLGLLGRSIWINPKGTKYKFGLKWSLLCLWTP